MMELLLQDKGEKRHQQTSKLKTFRTVCLDSYVKVLQQKFHFYSIKITFVGKLLFMCLYVTVELN